MRSYIRLKNRQKRKLPDQFVYGNDLRYTEELVAEFLREYTHSGDKILDPFAGFGTSMIVAEAMDREAYGIEYEADRVEYVRSLLRQPERIQQGDTRKLLDYNLPICDFSITSPPYMSRFDTVNALDNHRTPSDGYQAYLQSLVDIYGLVKQLLKPDAYIVLEISNMKEAQGITTLAWDLGRALSSILDFQGETILAWDHYNYGYDHSYCLVFRNRSPKE
jgi:hypothetical protein